MGEDGERMGGGWEEGGAIELACRGGGGLPLPRRPDDW